jgi:hypothetical protein
MSQAVVEAGVIVLPDGERIRPADLRDIYFECRPNAQPALVMISRQGRRHRVSSADGLGALQELAEAVVAARDRTP